MTAPVFLAPPGSLPAAGGVAVIDGDEGRHAVTVRRLQVGEPVELVDGAGARASGTVAATQGKAQLHVHVERIRHEPPAAPRLVVVQAIPKGERGELAVAAMTEVGVDVVVPWAAERCVVRWRSDRAARGVSRWRRTARESAKQARRAYLPEVTDVVDSAAVGELLTASATGLVLHEQAESPLSGRPLSMTGEIVLVVGPEGGISPAELACFAAAGATAVRLGPTVLRTSTAGTAAAAVVLAATGRWA